MTDRLDFIGYDGPMDKPTHGGRRPGAGRKAVDQAKPETKFLVPMTNAQKAKVKALGGSAWLRAQIDAAKTQPLK